MPRMNFIIRELLAMLKRIGLDEYWLLAVSSLIAQEIAVKKKLDELNVQYGDDDFQKIADKLIDAMKKRGREPPEILLSIIRSYRFTRARLLHDPHKTAIGEKDAIAIFNNTRALIEDLLCNSITKFDINNFIKDVDTSLDSSLKTFNEYDKRMKKELFQRIMEFIPDTSQEEIQKSKLFDFIESAIKVETDESLQAELFEILLLKAISLSNSAYNPAYERLLSVMANLTKLGSIKSFIRKKGYIKPLIAIFETSNSFRLAQINAEIMLNLSSLLDSEHLDRIINASIDNDQILYSFGAQRALGKLFDLNKDKIPQEKLEMYRRRVKE